MHQAQEIDQETDQNLLLLAHGALPLWPRLRMQVHLRRCTACRARLTQLTQTSALLAAAVRGPILPTWSRSQAVTRASLPVSKQQTLLIFALLTLLVLGLAYFLARAFFALPPPAAQSVTGGCRPDLPNSRCR